MKLKSIMAANMKKDLILKILDLFKRHVHACVIRSSSTPVIVDQQAGPNESWSGELRSFDLLTFSFLLL